MDDSLEHHISNENIRVEENNISVTKGKVESNHDYIESKRAFSFVNEQENRNQYLYLSTTERKGLSKV